MHVEHGLAFIMFTPPLPSLASSAPTPTLVIFLFTNSPLLFSFFCVFNLDSEYEGKHALLFLSGSVRVCI